MGMIMLNVFSIFIIWCDPVVFEVNEEKITKRLKFLQWLMKSLGVDIVSDHLLRGTKLLLENLYANERK